MKPLKIGDFQGPTVNLPEGKPPFSYRFPMMFPFSYGFPMVFQPVGPISYDPTMSSQVQIAFAWLTACEGDLHGWMCPGRGRTPHDLRSVAPNSEHRCGYLHESPQNGD